MYTLRPLTEIGSGLQGIQKEIDAVLLGLGRVPENQSKALLEFDVGCKVQKDRDSQLWESCSWSARPHRSFFDAYQITSLLKKSVETFAGPASAACTA